MPSKPETVLKKIGLLPSHQLQLCLKFKDWLVDENDNTERNWINYLRTFADAQADGDILCDAGDIAVSFLNGEIENIIITPLKADNQTASSGDPIIGYNIEFGAPPDGLSIVCLDLTP